MNASMARRIQSSELRLIETIDNQKSTQRNWSARAQSHPHIVSCLSRCCESRIGQSAPQYPKARVA